MSMKLGLTMFATDLSMPVADLARAAEARGFFSLYIPEHTHIPASRLTPPPMGDEVLPEEYRRTLDPFVALASAAAVTERILLGTGICLVAQRDPLLLAKEVASLDLVSGGRFVFGIGFGWNREEMASHGVDFSTRRAMVREKMLAMGRLWRDEEAAFRGDFVAFEPSWAWPKPQGGSPPPVLLGGAAGPKLFAHIAEYGDGWMPIGGAGIAKVLPDLHRAAESAGRDPSDLAVVPFGTVPERDKFEYYASIGIAETVLRVPSAPAEEVLPVLDRYAAFL